MPFLTLNLWPGVAAETKNQWIWEATRITSTLLNIPPDKIQVLITDVPRENWGKAGSTPTNPDFPRESRVIDQMSRESYHDGASPVGNMAVLTVDVWNVFSQQQKNQWTGQLTRLTVDLLNTPADKVLILFHDMPPGNWGQSGVTGADPHFLEKSRSLG